MPGHRPHFGTFETHSPLTAVAIPFAMALAALVEFLGLGSAFFLTGAWPHEFGHAVAAWLCGYIAFPTPFFTLSFAEEPSSKVSYFSMSLVIICYVYWRVRSRDVPPFEARLIRSGFLLIIIALIKLSWLSTVAGQQQVILFSGTLGEFALSALCIALFGMKSVPIPRWDFWRFFVLLFGALHFWFSWSHWGKILAGSTAFPWGSLMSGENTGDFSRLRDLYGWTQGEFHYVMRRVRWAFGGVVLVCAIAQVLGYLRFKKVQPKEHEPLLES